MSPTPKSPAPRVSNARALGFQRRLQPTALSVIAPPAPLMHGRQDLDVAPRDQARTPCRCGSVIGGGSGPPPPRPRSARSRRTQPPGPPGGALRRLAVEDPVRVPDDGGCSLGLPEDLREPAPWAPTCRAITSRQAPHPAPPTGADPTSPTRRAAPRRTSTLQERLASAMVEHRRLVDHDRHPPRSAGLRGANLRCPGSNSSRRWRAASRPVASLIASRRGPWARASRTGSRARSKSAKMARTMVVLPHAGPPGDHQHAASAPPTHGVPLSRRQRDLRLRLERGDRCVDALHEARLGRRVALVVAQRGAHPAREPHLGLVEVLRVDGHLAGLERLDPHMAARHERVDRGRRPRRRRARASPRRARRAPAAPPACGRVSTRSTSVCKHARLRPLRRVGPDADRARDPVGGLEADAPTSSASRYGERETMSIAWAPNRL